MGSIQPTIGRQEENYNHQPQATVSRESIARIPLSVQRAAADGRRQPATFEANGRPLTVDGQQQRQSRCSDQTNLPAGQARLVYRVNNLHQLHRLDRAVDRRFITLDRLEEILHLQHEVVLKIGGLKW